VIGPCAARAWHVIGPHGTASAQRWPSIPSMLGLLGIGNAAQGFPARSVGQAFKPKTRYARFRLVYLMT